MENLAITMFCIIIALIVSYSWMLGQQKKRIDELSDEVDFWIRAYIRKQLEK